MPVISVRIDDELKRKMDKYKFINWSEVIRSELTKFIERLKKSCRSFASERES